MKKAIVTGASGYIGGQTLLHLKDQGIWAMGIDRMPLPEHLKGVPDSFVMRDFADRQSLYELNGHHVDAVIHCAGSSLVGPSVSDPADYYDNNFVKTKALADHILTYKLPTRIIFSSSSSVYGQPIFNPCAEQDPIMPLSPYGQSKAMIEWMFAAYHQAYGLDYVAFRYFNACGADSQARHGQEPGATHIIARLLETARDGGEFTLNGVDFDTPDGTCVRDYTHVEDIAESHVMAMDRKIPVGSYNLGTGQAHSNRNIVDLVQDITGVSLTIKQGPARPGDPAMSTASPDLWKDRAGWQPRWTVEDAVHHAWAWYNR